MVPLFTWIHLSDIHAGHGDGEHAADQQLVLNELLTDIKNAPSRDIPKINSIFVTGDLAFSGNVRSKNEYDRVKDWLAQVANTVGIGSDKIFVVPGNHDVQRNVEEQKNEVHHLLRRLRSGEEKIDNVLTNRRNRALLTKRMQNYLRFAANHAPANCLGQLAELFWVYQIPLRQGLKIRLVGLNTALLAAKEEDSLGDQRRLQLGRQQLTRAVHSIDEGKEIVILLSHHPFSWLRDEDSIVPIVNRYAHILLCGHVHNAQTARYQLGSGREVVSVISGATHNEAVPPNLTAQHGYWVSSLLLNDKGTLTLRLWPRVWSKKYQFRTDLDSLPTEDDNGQRYSKDFIDYELPLRISYQVPLPSARRTPDELMAYHLNRDDAVRDLEEAITHHKENRVKQPLICMVHSSDLERNDLFLKRLQRSFLPQLLTHWYPVNGPLQDFNLRLSLQRMSDSNHADVLWKDLRAVTHGHRPVLKDQIVDYIVGLKPGLIIKSDILAQDLDRNSFSALRRVIEFWTDWHFLPDDLLCLVCLCFTYQREGHWSEFRRNRLVRKRNRQLHQYLTEMKMVLNRGKYRSCVVELRPVKRVDAETFISLPEIREYFGFVPAHIRSLYENRLLCVGDDIPMEYLLQELTEIHKKEGLQPTVANQR